MGRALPIMVQGTMSGAGKSLLCTALCRIFRQDGWRVAPFKSQNMALNSCVTKDGGEMGRAQVVQAQAAGTEPDVRMNPVLLKPCTDVGSQVIVNGKVRAQMGAKEYYAYKSALLPDVKAAYDSLAEEYDIIVIEGAGSPAEINLRENDFVNMGLAELVDAPVLLVGDIDRGGVFAQLAGTAVLLEPEETARIKGFVINKFRGDRSILDPGLSQIESRYGIPVLGVLPYSNVDIDEEDSMASRLQKTETGALDIAVIRFPRLSNFTDFSPLESHPMTGVRYVSDRRSLGEPDLILLPGTKSTLSDLSWLKETGLEAKILQAHEKGTPVLGICGGYQMMGRKLSDPEGLEGGGTLQGLGLLPMDTVFREDKRLTESTLDVTAPFFLDGALTGCHAEGYEIHDGVTVVEGDAFGTLTGSDGTHPDGCSTENAAGTYLHGLFDTGEVTERLVQALLERKGETYDPAAALSHAEYQEQQYDLLADIVRGSLDMEQVYRILRKEV